MYGATGTPEPAVLAGKRESQHESARHLLGLAAALGLVCASTASADRGTLDSMSMVARADLVFEGVVEKVDYAISDAQGGARPHLPHTFVTYHIDRVIRGSTPADTITLRFIGGRGERASFLMVSGLPLFDVGDRDVLFVAKNGESGCPLVGCTAGRLREIAGAVFNEDGRSVALDADGELELGAYYDLPEVMTHYVSHTEIRRHDHFDQGESRQAFAPDRGAQLTAEDLVARLRTSAGALPAVEAQVRSADIRQPFALRPIATMPPPEERARVAPREHGRTAQERAELQSAARLERGPAPGAAQ